MTRRGFLAACSLSPSLVGPGPASGSICPSCTGGIEILGALVTGVRGDGGQARLVVSPEWDLARCAACGTIWTVGPSTTSP